MFKSNNNKEKKPNVNVLHVYLLKRFVCEVDQLHIRVQLEQFMMKFNKGKELKCEIHNKKNNFFSSPLLCMFN